jgi:TatD DNase family protein
VRGYAGLTDTHCHLQAAVFDDDRLAVVERARAAGVTRILVPGTDLESSARAVKLAAEVEEVRGAVGVHPHEAKTWDAAAERTLRGLAGQAGVAAIGEIGLDYHRMYSPREAQREAFRSQLDLAGELRLPVIVHIREALDDTLEALSEWSADAHGHSPRGVLHAFGGDGAGAAWAMAHGWSLGIGGTISYAASGRLREMMQDEALLGSILLETDAPYLPPQERRGRRNEPALVALVAEHLAAASGLEVERVIELTRRTAQSLFRWEPA